MEYLTLQPKERLFHINSETDTAGVLTLEDTRWLAASRNLNGVAFKLYIYLASQKDGTACVLLPEEIAKRLGVCLSSLENAINELVKARYLAQRGDREYTYSPVPQ